MSTFTLRCAMLLFTIIYACVASGRADSLRFTGTATLGGDIVDFFITGTSVSLYSAAPGGPAGFLFRCETGKTCQVPDFSIFAFSSEPYHPGNFSGGTVNGVTAYALVGSLDFSPARFFVPAEPSGRFTRKGRVTYSGFLQGFVFLPLGCEQGPSGSCDSLGPEVFNIFLSGTGTVTATGTPTGAPADKVAFYRVEYNFNSRPTPVPEPSSILLVGSGLTALAKLWRRRAKFVRPVDDNN